MPRLASSSPFRPLGNKRGAGINTTEAKNKAKKGEKPRERTIIEVCIVKSVNKKYWPIDQLFAPIHTIYRGFVSFKEGCWILP